MSRGIDYRFSTALGSFLLAYLGSTFNTAHFELKFLLLRSQTAILLNFPSLLMKSTYPQSLRIIDTKTEKFDLSSMP